MELILEHIFKTYDDKEFLSDSNNTFQQGKICSTWEEWGRKTTLFNILAEEIERDMGEAYLSIGKEKDYPLMTYPLCIRNQYYQIF